MFGFTNANNKPALVLSTVPGKKTCPTFNLVHHPETLAIQFSPCGWASAKKMLSVLGQPLRHYGTKKEVQFQAKDGSCTSVNLEVTDAARAIVSQERNADTRP